MLICCMGQEFYWFRSSMAVLALSCFPGDIDSFPHFTHVWVKHLWFAPVVLHAWTLWDVCTTLWDVREACIGINLIREFFLSLVNFPLEEHKQLLTWQTCVYILRYFYNEGASFLLLPVLWICCRSCDYDIESGKVCNYRMNKQFQFEQI